MKPLTHGSLFAGIGGFDAGFRDLGMQVVWQVEIEPFPRSILRTRFPEAELFSDVRECGKHNLRAVDVLTAGFPCQDLSVAGKRAGLAGARSGLLWEVVRILGELRPAWFVLENVPGLFSSNNGEDFRIVLESLSDLGYGLAWRVLDSQFFGVAQRRRRVFIVGSFGKPCPQEVLFESEGGEGDFAQGGETGTGVAAPLTSGIGASGKPAGRRCEDDVNLAVAYALREDPGGIGQGHNTTYAITENMRNRSQGPANYVAAPITASYGKQIDSSNRNGGPPNIVQQAISSKWAKGSSGPAGDEHHNLIAIQDVRGHRDKKQNGIGIDESGGAMYTLDGTSQHAAAFSAPADSDRVRSFAGLPEGLDSARYRALGNAVTAKVAEWIGRRIVAAASSGSQT